MKSLKSIKLLQIRSVRGFLGILCFLLAVVVIGVALVDHNIKPIALSVAEARVHAIASDAINRAVRQCVQGITYDDLVSVTRDSQGRVAMLQANSAQLNHLASSTTLTAQEFISQIEPSQLKIPLGSAFGGQIFSGRGPMIPVRIIPAGSVVSEFQTSFNTAGINQTRHEIYLKLTANMRVAIPVGAKPIEVSVLVPVAESVIVGEVPQTFIQILDGEGLLPLVPN